MLVLLVMVTLLDSALLLALWCMVRLVVQIRAMLARVVRRRGLRVLVVVRFWSVWARVVVARVVRRRCLRVLVVVRLWSVWARVVVARVVRRRCLRVLVVVRLWSVWVRVVVARVVFRRCLRVLVCGSRSNATNDLVGRLWGRRGVVLVQVRAAMRAMGHSR